MANIKENKEYRVYAAIDTAPGIDGFWTDEISISNKKLKKVFFSVRGTGDCIVTLQFKCYGDTDWTDFGTYLVGDRKPLEEDAVDVIWRMGVKSGDWTSGNIRFGFDWS